MELRYASMLTTVWVTFMYSSTLPLLYFFAALSFFVSFWVDKFFLLKFNRTPHNYTQNLSLYCIKLMKASLVIHFMMGLVMLSNRAVLPS
jgi:hypothetical protein